MQVSLKEGKLLHNRWRIIKIIIAFSLLLGVSYTVVSEAALAQTDDENEIWEEPVNLSQSGSARDPVFAAAPDGTLHALWWDEIEGTQYSYTTDQGWSEPISVPQIIGSREFVPREGGFVIRPPQGLRLFASSSGWVHVFWIDTGTSRRASSDLRYSRLRVGSQFWSAPSRLVSVPLKWDVSLDANDNLHLAYVHSGVPSGVFYRTSRNDGANWSLPETINESLYFRTQPAEQAHVKVSADGNGMVFVTWDDPLLDKSFYTISNDGGSGFGEVLPVGEVEGDFATQAQVIPVLSETGSSFLQVWKANEGACELYQQLSTDNGASWGSPIRILDTVSSCPRVSYRLAGNDLLLVPSRGLLAGWDGVRWTQPLSLQIRFENPVTERVTSLGCLDSVLVNNRVAVIGCDANGDIWVTTSTLTLPELLVALSTAWSPPTILSQQTNDVSLPEVAVDADGQIHTLWSKSFSSDDPGAVLEYIRGDGQNWSVSNEVLRSPQGKADLPDLLFDPAGLLHAVWSGGFQGATYYSWAFLRDAPSASDWSASRALPAPRTVGGWPNIIMDQSGVLHVVYAVPLNEDRGIYYVRSEDQGETWSEPTIIFDAARAQWAMVKEVEMTIDMRGRLHVVWTRAALPEPSTPLGVFYVRSDDGGNTWTDVLEVSSGTFENPHVIAATGDQIHLVWVGTTVRRDLWHLWSPDGGQSWSIPAQLQILSAFSSDVGLATDNAGTVYLVGIERTNLGSAALFHIQWDGQSWGNRESFPLGFNPVTGSGTKAVLLPSGNLGVFFRVWSPDAQGGAHYVVGYTQRPVEVGEITPIPTFTPIPTLESSPTVTPQPTFTPLPTIDLNAVPTPSVDDALLLQIGGLLVGMCFMVLFAVFMLRRRG